jgi:hypothetical protein
MTLMPLLPMLLSSQLLTLAADQVPSFDFSSSCRAAATMTPATLDSCMNDERSAREALASQWPQFAAQDKAYCDQSARMGGMASYVELLTCLQMARDARQLPADKKQ